MITKGINNLVTHNGSFHADDIFACATLHILLDGRIRVTRTREPELIQNADIVFDVGGIYDPETDRFDHHQSGGGGKRPNGIDYASFGLVWKKYGEQICGDKEVAEEIDRKIAAPIDAIDNGIDIVTSKFGNIFPYNADQIFLAYHPTWKEVDVNMDEIFMEQVEKAVEVLKREIQVGKDDAEGRRIIVDSYNKAEDKRIVILETSFPRYLIQKTLSKFPEPIYVIYPGIFGKNWKAEAIAKNPNTLESRKMFPESWRFGINNDPRLKELTGVPDALFAHRGGFLITSHSKEGAIAIAKKSLLVKEKKNLWHLLTS
ncbi:MAG: MYG1 family protein [Patescibacteria group bacterium]